MKHRENALKIFDRAVEAVNPYSLVKESLLRENNELVFSGIGDNLRVDLSEYERVFLVAVGKAACPMAKAAGEVLSDRLTEAIVVTKYDHLMPIKDLRVIEAAHPIPDNKSQEAARAVIELAEKASEDTLVIFLISGGASSLLALPLSTEYVSLGLEDIKATTSTLLACGARIDEINCIRKHLSAIKGGRLAQAVYPARFVSLILSDVIGDPISSIASGPTVPDESSWQDALDIVDKYSIRNSLPVSVVKLLEAGSRGDIKDTPSGEDECFKNGKSMIIGNNLRALLAAKKEAIHLGYEVMLLTDSIAGEASQLGLFFASLALGYNKDKAFDKPVCFIAGGESTVTIRGRGKGGRNQEIALSFAISLAEKEIYRDFAFLSGATDGNDGPTDAAGGIIDRNVVDFIKKEYTLMSSMLYDNNSYYALQKAGALLITGPTNTNVCDVQILLIDA
ncbi:glycerate kinase [Spirochaetia bacterium 38H-sp]|uniref:Glycerate kinase n=1 Tax=Rarispira pelagica TaxID=3141764 RepID=A0ABU9UAI1_9SPIR